MKKILIALLLLPPIPVALAQQPDDTRYLQQASQQTVAELTSVIISLRATVAKQTDEITKLRAEVVKLQPAPPADPPH